MTKALSRADAMRDARDRLARSETPARDARDLLLHVLDIDAATLIAGDRELLTEQEARRYEAAILRRMASEPVSRIMGERGFYGLDFAVTPAVLDPRPDTETLIDAVLEHVDAGATYRILDLGTGSGCILLTLLHGIPGATGLGVDASTEALEVARENARRLHLSRKARFLRSDWLEKVDGTFDLVVCNPPYIGEHEASSLSDDVLLWDPKEALFADGNGLAAYRAIASTLGGVLSETGTAFFEIGSGQGEAVTRIFSEAGFGNITFRRDIAGIRRCLIVRKA